MQDLQNTEGNALLINVFNSKKIHSLSISNQIIILEITKDKFYRM
jgi:predicted ATP-grasp superfamily ATP-dependent carboligase